MLQELLRNFVSLAANIFWKLSGDKELEDFLLPLEFYLVSIKRCVLLFIFYCYYMCLLLFWTFIDGSTCIHPQRTPKKLKFWKFCATRGTGCLDADRAAFPGLGDTQGTSYPLADTTPTVWHIVTWVLELKSYFSTLESASLTGGEMCVKHRKLPPDAVGDGWWGGSLSTGWCKNSFVL